MMPHDFSFAEHAPEFDSHIEQSIPGVRQLRSMCVGLSRRFVQNGTTVLDIGCSTGSLLSAIRHMNQPARLGARYVGIDAERAFAPQWRERRAPNLTFQVCDARNFRGYRNLSLVTCLFTLQFLGESDRLPLLRRLHDALIPGGALIIAEKVFAPSAQLQDALTFDYLDMKLQHFSEREILGKERALRGQMRLWTEQQLVSALCEAGFQSANIVEIWRNYLFVAKLGIKTWER
jgi:tRNA (cmo5U34)-methyltransferase